jgi:hypothetical protein
MCDARGVVNSVWVGLLDPQKATEIVLTVTK